MLNTDTLERIKRSPFVRGLACGIVATDAQARFTYVNDRFLEMHGGTEADLLGARTHTTSADPEHAEEWTPKEQVEHLGNLRPQAWTLLRADGGTLPVTTIPLPFDGPTGPALYLVFEREVLEDPDLHSPDIGLELVLAAQRIRAIRRLLFDAFRERGLTPREAEAASYVTGGVPRQEIARSMGISPNTLRNYTRNGYAKLGVSSRAGLLRLVSRL